MRNQNTPSTAVVPSEYVRPETIASQHNVAQPVVYQSFMYQSAPYQRPRPRIAKGIFVLLVSGLAGLIVFAMGQTVWGAIWRGWIVTAIIAAILYFVL